MVPVYCRQIKNLRLTHKYTQNDVADFLSIRQEQYSKYESGNRELPLHLLVKLCRLYRVSSDYILGLNID